MDKKYRIITKYGTVYEIDEHGCFLRYNNHYWECPHDSWRCVGCAEVLPFNRLKYYSLPEFLKMIENGHNFRFKNGNPKFTLLDCDHGTYRIHGNIKAHGISMAYRIK